MKQHDVVVIGAVIAGLTAATLLAGMNPKPQTVVYSAFSRGGSPIAVLTGKLATNSILKSRGEV